MIQFVLVFLYNWYWAGEFIRLAAGEYLLHSAWVLKLCAVLHITPTMHHVVYLVAAVLLLSVALLNTLPQVTTLTLWLAGARRPNDELATYLYGMRDVLGDYAGKSLDKYQIFVDPSYELNAYAIGRRHIVFNEPMLALPEEELLGIMAHELGHLECRHTTYGSMMYAMELVTRLFFRLFDIGVKVVLLITSIIPFLGVLATLAAYVYSLLLWINWNVIYRTIYYIGLFFSRRHEYEADAYACKIGLGVELYNALLHFQTGQTSFWEEFQSTHPGTTKRLRAIRSRLEAEGVVAPGEETVVAG